MKPYAEHLSSTHDYGQTIDLTRKPCFRSSAIFAVRHDQDFSTRILFMGYWLLKRNISEVCILITLRSEKGRILIRKQKIIDSPRAFSIEIGQLLYDIEYDFFAPFIGSIELEVFSTRDLVFPYPAFVLNYYNDSSVGAVHTAGRVYNDVEDLTENEEVFVPESGFDISLHENSQPFFSFVNGLNFYPACHISCELIGQNDQKLDCILNLGQIEPYQTVFIFLKEHFDLSLLAPSTKATIKIHHNLKGLFPRFVSGNFDTVNKAVSITHTYYDCSNQTSASDYWVNTDDRLNDSVILIPLFIGENIYTQLVFYPILSPTSFDASLDFYTSDGMLVYQIQNWKRYDTRQDGFFTVDFGDILQQKRLSLEKISMISSVNIRLNWSGTDRMPTRLKFGLNVGMRGKNANLPCNIAVLGLTRYDRSR
jgi:hypothetical protein